MSKEASFAHSKKSVGKQDLSLLKRLENEFNVLIQRFDGNVLSLEGD